MNENVETRSELARYLGFVHSLIRLFRGNKGLWMIPCQECESEMSKEWIIRTKWLTELSEYLAASSTVFLDSISSRLQLKINISSQWAQVREDFLNRGIVWGSDLFSFMLKDDKRIRSHSNIFNWGFFPNWLAYWKGVLCVKLKTCIIFGGQLLPDSNRT